jgi:hypothetical protein
MGTLWLKRCTSALQRWSMRNCPGKVFFTSVGWGRERGLIEGGRMWQEGSLCAATLGHQALRSVSCAHACY